MAFNMLHTFQRNKRFWMAAILGICMISFVFCTGGATENLPKWLSRRGAGVFQIDGRTYTTQDLYELRTQRNLANKLMINCTDMAIKKLNKTFFEMDKKKDAAAGKDAQARAERLVEIQALRQSLSYKKSRPRYFDGGVKYDDLVEFAMWQAVADRLGIYLEDEHVKFLYYLEFYAMRVPLDEEEIKFAQRETLRDFRDAGPGLIFKAVKEEFRVRIAQEAVLLAQPMQFRRRQDGVGIKLVDPEIPDQIRAPLTLAQLWDQYEKTRAEFDVNLLPLDVEKFMKKIDVEPTEKEKEDFFDKYKDKIADPGSDARGLQMPIRVKIEYLLADPESPAYLESAKALQALKLTSPFAPDAVLSPLAAATRYCAAYTLHRVELQDQYDNLGRNERALFPITSSFAAGDGTTAILARLANRHPQACAHLVGNALLTPADGLGALAGYVAWGATPEHKDEVHFAAQAEAKRRSPAYATVVASGASGSPLDVLGPSLFLEFLPYPPKLPLEAVEKEIEEILVRRVAEEKAQQNMQIVRAALNEDDGDPEKFKRDLNKFVPEMKLTYGPADKSVAINRYSADSAPELAPLHKSYLKYLDAINLFEARDVTPERLLKPNDFYRLFFDTSEPFAATTPYRAMPWPPRVKASSARIVKAEPDPRLVNRMNVDPKAREAYMEQLRQHNPQQQAAPPPFDGLFSSAEKPMLFWRTSERIPQRPNKYADIAKDMQAKEIEMKTVQENLKKQTEVAQQVDALRRKETDLKAAKADAREIDKIAAERAARFKELVNLRSEAGGDLKALTRRESDLKEDVADLKEIQRLVVEGWKFDRARATEVLPVAKEIAETLIKNRNLVGLDRTVEKYNVAQFTINGLCKMYPEDTPDSAKDYGKPPLPKDRIPYPRDDMIDQLVGLNDLEKPIKLGNEEIYKNNKELSDLDELNAELYESVKKQVNPRGHYVQILTNKPRTVYYVAYLPKAAEANRERFITSLRLAAPPQNENEQQIRMMMDRFVMDRWVERIQQRDGRAYRAAVVDSLKKKTFGYEELSADARKRFDDQVVGD